MNTIEDLKMQMMIFSVITLTGGIAGAIPGGLGLLSF
jgi:hypothetical protein